MTNETIILSNAFQLMERGIIKGSGKYGNVQDESGADKLIELPEAIHTFQEWKNNGFVVRKGEKACAKFSIWRYKAGKKTEAEADENKVEIIPGSFFKVTAAFFSASQVTPIV